MTNGVVSVVVDGKVAMKIVCGCDGYNAPALVRLMKLETEVPPVEVVRDWCRSVGFGCGDCLVIQTPEALDPHGEDATPDIVARYRSTFSDPEANPRWEHKAEYTEVVTFGHSRSSEATRRAPQPVLDLTQAVRIAAEVHGAQRDKAGEPYLMHVFRVADAMQTDEERVVAILHDAIEDAPDRNEIGLRIFECYGEDVSEAVDMLTHYPSLSYLDYIRRLAKNPLAVKVKLADIQDNRKPERLRKLPRAECDRLYDKYEKAWLTLYAAADEAGTLPATAAFASPRAKS